MNSRTLYKTLNITSDESSRVFLLLIQSLFLGFFYGAFDVSAHTLFLDVFKEDMIAKAYAVSGLAGILLTSVYSTLQKRISFTTLSIINYIFIALLTSILWIGNELFQSNALIFIIFVLMGPLNILAIIGFWGTASRMFTLRQGKRIFSLVDSGQIIGIIISGSVIALLTTIDFETNNILLIGSISVCGAFFMQLFIKNHIENPIGYASVKQNEPVSRFTDIFKNSYTSKMAYFVILSMVVAFFVQYNFLVVTKDNYPGEQELARFLSAFMSILMTFTLLVKTFVYSKFIKTFGIKVSLALSPILIVLFTLIATLAGYIFGYTSAAAAFSVYFLLIALSRLFSKSLKDAFEIPNIKILYQSLDIKIRHLTQARIDGTVNEIAALFSGLLLTALSSLAFIKLIHFTTILNLILFLWIINAISLYKEYRKSLAQTLSGFKQDNSTAERKIFKPNKPVKSDSSKESTINSATKMLSEKNVLDDLNRFDADLKLTVLKNIHNYSEEIALKILKILLRDPDSTVVENAIGKLIKYHDKEAISAAIELLPAPDLHSLIMETLGKINDGITESSISNYNKSTSTSEQKILIIRLISRIAHLKGFEFLVNQLDTASMEIYKHILIELTNSNFIPDNLLKQKLLDQIKTNCQSIAIDYNLQQNLESAGINNSRLVDCLSTECHRKKELIYLLLAVLYDSNSVYHIRENIESGVSESVGFGLELLDQFLDEEIKTLIFTILEDTSINEKVRLLQHEFPLPKLGYSEILLHIINRSYNELLLHTKFIALECYFENFAKTDLPDTIIALLFNSNMILKTLAFRMIQKYHPNVPVRIANRFRHFHSNPINQLKEYLSQPVFPMADEIYKTVTNNTIIQQFNPVYYPRFITLFQLKQVTNGNKLILNNVKLVLGIKGHITFQADNDTFSGNSLLINDYYQEILINTNDLAWMVYMTEKDFSRLCLLYPELELQLNKLNTKPLPQTDNGNI